MSDDAMEAAFAKAIGVARRLRPRGQTAEVAAEYARETAPAFIAAGLTASQMRKTALFWCDRAEHWARLDEPKLAMQACAMAAALILSARRLENTAAQERGA